MLKKLKAVIPAAAIVLLSSCAGSEPRIISHDLTSCVMSEDVPVELANIGTKDDATMTDPADEEDPAQDWDVTGTSAAVGIPVPAVTRSVPPPAEYVTETPDDAEKPAELSSAPETSTDGTDAPGTSSRAVPPARPSGVSTVADARTPSAAGKSAGQSGKYSFEFQSMNGSAMILGPNLVYVGETFDFNFTYPDISDESRMVWNIVGDCGTIEKNGLFTAVKKGNCTVMITDTSSGTFAALRVHCIENADDVDFIPLVNNIPIANKTYPLPKDYAPGFSPAADTALKKMFADASAEGLNLFVISSYRSYDYQKDVYAGWKRMYGSDADLVSARPGHSEHQLGLAVDLNACEYSFADTREGKWLKEHCAEYGFILRYPSNEARAYTGYSYEPWHIRYLGADLAKSVMASGKTLEELLGIDSYYR